MTDLNDWPALVLTAGLATRLRPLSNVRAKAAMPVAGEAIIERILKWLRAAGVRRAVLNLHHRPETITRIVGDGSQWDLDLRYSWEREVLGSAGGPRRALPLLADRFLIVNGDTLTNCDLQAVADRHVNSGALVTMAVVPGDVARYGGVCVDGDQMVHGFGRCAEQMQALHFIGVQAVEAAAFATVADDRPSETVKTLYPQLLARRRGAIAAMVSDAEFLDVGTAADYLQTVKAVSEREGRAFDRGDDCRVDAAAHVYQSVLWDRVTVAAGASLINCVVADGVTVAEHSRYERCVLTSSPDGVAVTPL